MTDNPERGAPIVPETGIMASLIPSSQESVVSIFQSAIRALKRLPGLSLLIGGAIVMLSMPLQASPGAGQDATASGKPVLTVYKSPSCGCCGKWISHVEEAGFTSLTQHPRDLAAIKARYGVAPELQSCHTAVSREGFVFEGHVPARYVKQFLANPPEGASGLAVPAMPVGSPGMEVGDRFMPYQVLLLNRDGSVAVFAEVNSAEEQ